MAKPNYQFEKRQRDLAKKRKKEEKLRNKQAARNAGGASDGATDGLPDDGDAQSGAPLTGDDQASNGAQSDGGTVDGEAVQRP